MTTMATSTLISRITSANITSTQSIPSTSVVPTTCSYLDMHIILDGGTITVIVLGILLVLASIGAIWMRQRRRGRLRPNGHRDTEEIGRAGGDEMESQVALNRLSEQASIDRHHEAVSSTAQANDSSNIVNDTAIASSSTPDEAASAGSTGEARSNRFNPEYTARVEVWHENQPEPRYRLKENMLLDSGSQGYSWISSSIANAFKAYATNCEETFQAFNGEVVTANKKVTLSLRPVRHGPY